MGRVKVLLTFQDLVHGHRKQILSGGAPVLEFNISELASLIARDDFTTLKEWGVIKSGGAIAPWPMPFSYSHDCSLYTTN